jgi:hypothetical protein
VRDAGVAEHEMEVVLRAELEHQRHAGRAERTARVLNPLAPRGQPPSSSPTAAVEMASAIAPVV